MILFKILSIIYLIHLYFIVKKEFAEKPTQKLLDELQNVHLTRYTKSDIIIGPNLVHIKPTDNWERNITAKFKPVTWFFIGTPSAKNISKNKISSNEIMIRIPFCNLEQDKIIYRKHDNVIGYLTEYRGYAEIEESNIPPIKRFNLFKNLTVWFTIAYFILLLPATFCLFGDKGLSVLMFIVCLLLVLIIVSRIRSKFLYL
ncbi:hypothetical protein [Paenibacillus polymyxa]|uniref:hypothetical protein n=1 Tax=Paenibacillus polymyxa TaxID=1406 RepID=UPI000845E4FD|nr:hypothetical protein [Paenibacillus polymyxa]AOK91777.1 hypothetical protein AOU00_19355 [Paenibacillus polymyxa]